jgi:hypothetical protein
MPVLLTNNAETTLNTAINASETALVVADGSVFPTPGTDQYFYATLVSQQGTLEIVKVTARSGNILTVTRGAESTTPNGFAVGTRVEARVTAASVSDIFGPPTVDNFTGTGAQVNFTLSVTPTSENYTMIYIDGVYQQKDGYSVSGTTLTFSEAPPLNSGIEVVTLRYD